MNTIRIRSRNLSNKDITIIISILDGWSEKKLTWDRLIDTIEFRTKQRYTRQTLAKHSKVKQAYNLTKERLADKDESNLKEPKSYDTLIQKINKLEGENARLIKENEALITQFARWGYNAYIKGITQEELDKDLPKVNRRQDL